MIQYWLLEFRKFFVCVILVGFGGSDDRFIMIGSVELLFYGGNYDVYVVGLSYYGALSECVTIEISAYHLIGVSALL